jgi:prepilin-type processing-associated H-X9-DG protein
MNSFLTGYKHTTTPHFRDAAYAGALDKYSALVPGQTLSGLVSVSQKILAADMVNGNYASLAGLVIYPPPVATNKTNNLQAIDVDVTEIPSSSLNGVLQAGRHFGGPDVLFVDGHVKWMKGGTPGLAFRDQGTGSCGSFSKEAGNLWAPYTDCP